MEAGLDSLGATELRSALAELAGDPGEQHLPATVVFDYPTAGALAGFLQHEVLPAHRGAGANTGSIGGAPDWHAQSRSARGMQRGRVQHEAGGRRGARQAGQAGGPVPLAEVVQLVSRTVGRAVGAEEPLMEAGLDSLGATELRSALAELAGDPGEQHLPATVVFDYPTAGALAGFLQHHLRAPSGGRQPASTPHAGCASLLLVDSSSAACPEVCPAPLWLTSLQVYGGGDNLAQGERGRAPHDAVTTHGIELWDVQTRLSREYERLPSRFRGGLHGAHLSAELGELAYSAAELLLLEPQQRQTLSVARLTLSARVEDAHRKRSSHAGVTAQQPNYSTWSVVVGVGGAADFASLVEAYYRGTRSYSTSGAAPSVACGRLAYVYGMHGACVSVDTACSASLVAVAVAVGLTREEAAREVHTDAEACALAGGTNCIVAPSSTHGLNAARMLSPEGRCKTLDWSADGYVRAEACGLTSIGTRSLHEDALGHGEEQASCVGRLVAVQSNQDGRSSSLTAPHGPSQQALIRSVAWSAEEVLYHSPRLQDAVLEQISVLELHGTGTALGDPIEAGAALSAMRARATCCRAGGSLLLAASKSRVGHAESGAGVCGLLSLVARLGGAHHEPPLLHLRTCNVHVCALWEARPHSSFEHATARLGRGAVAPPLRVQRGSEDTALGALSAFAFQGTNAHAICEQASTSGSRTVCTDRCFAHGHARCDMWATAWPASVTGSLPQLAEAHHTATAVHICLDSPRSAYLLENRVAARSLLPATAMLEGARACAKASTSVESAGEPSAASGVGAGLEALLFVRPLELTREVCGYGVQPRSRASGGSSRGATRTAVVRNTVTSASFSLWLAEAGWPQQQGSVHFSGRHLRAYTCGGSRGLGDARHCGGVARAERTRSSARHALLAGAADLGRPATLPKVKCCAALCMPSYTSESFALAHPSCTDVSLHATAAVTQHGAPRKRAGSALRAGAPHMGSADITRVPAALSVCCAYPAGRAARTSMARWERALGSTSGRSLARASTSQTMHNTQVTDCNLHGSARASVTGRGSLCIVLLSLEARLLSSTASAQSTRGKQACSSRSCAYLESGYSFPNRVQSSPALRLHNLNKGQSIVVNTGPCCANISGGDIPSIVTRVVCEVLGDIGVDEPFINTGVDSLAVAELNNRLINATGLSSLPSQLTITYPNLNTLIKYIEGCTEDALHSLPDTASSDYLFSKLGCEQPDFAYSQQQEQLHIEKHTCTNVSHSESICCDLLASDSYMLHCYPFLNVNMQSLTRLPVGKITAGLQYVQSQFPMAAGIIAKDHEQKLTKFQADNAGMIPVSVFQVFETCKRMQQISCMKHFAKWPTHLYRQGQNVMHLTLLQTIDGIDYIEFHLSHGLCDSFGAAELLEAFWDGYNGKPLLTRCGTFDRRYALQKSSSSSRKKRFISPELNVLHKREQQHWFTVCRNVLQKHTRGPNVRSSASSPLSLWAGLLKGIAHLISKHSIVSSLITVGVNVNLRKFCPELARYLGNACITVPILLSSSLLQCTTISELVDILKEYVHRNSLLYATQYAMVETRKSTQPNTGIPCTRCVDVYVNDRRAMHNTAATIHKTSTGPQHIQNTTHRFAGTTTELVIPLVWHAKQRDNIDTTEVFIDTEELVHIKTRDCWSGELGSLTMHFVFPVDKMSFVPRSTS